MALPVVFLPEAQDEIDSEYAKYERQSVGLGERFLRVLRTELDLISANPTMYAVKHQDIRAALMRRFPYVIYYRVETDRVVIIAVQHGQRSSRLWKSRA